MNVTIGNYINEKLSEDSRMAGKIFPVMAVFNSPTPTTPYIVYERTGCEFGYTKGLFDNSIRHSYTVSVYDDNYASTMVLAQAIINLMLSLSYTEKPDIYFKAIHVTDLSEDFLEGIFYQTIQFEINTTQKYE